MKRLMLKAFCFQKIHFNKSAGRRHTLVNPNKEGRLLREAGLNGRQAGQKDGPDLTANIFYVATKRPNKRKQVS